MVILKRKYLVCVIMLTVLAFSYIISVGLLVK